MPTVGAHALVFSGEFDRAGTERTARIASESGFDLVELVMMDPYIVDVPVMKDVLSKYDLKLSGSLGLPAHADVSSEDPEIVARGEEYLNKVLDVLHELGAEHMIGVIFSALQKYTHAPTQKGRQNSIEVMRKIGERAQKLGMSVGLEVVNRYETNMLNTSKQAVAFVNEVDHPNVGIHLDTYHMNIEEPDMFQPVIDAGDKLCYVHIGESHRGYLGSGNVDFDNFFKALHRIGYNGPITFESFSSAVVNPNLTIALSIWRDLWTDSEDLGRHANNFIRGKIRSAEAVNYQ
jgi:D-psicose/D-tagatose/L-ribulose 3-epimerase